MRYTLNHGIPQIVRVIEVDGHTVTNPTDALVDQIHAGWPLAHTAQPSYDPTTQYVVQGWTQDIDAIRETWTVLAKTTEMLIDDIDQQIATINVEFAGLADVPVQYPTDGRYYLLGWAREYYAPLLLKSDVEYPTPVADTTLTTLTKTKAELQALYDYLIAEGAARTVATNTALAELYARRQELENQNPQEATE